MNKKDKKPFMDYFLKAYEDFGASNQTSGGYWTKYKTTFQSEWFRDLFPVWFSESKIKNGNNFVSCDERCEYIGKQLHQNRGVLLPHVSVNSIGSYVSAIKDFSAFVWSFFDANEYCDRLFKTLANNYGKIEDILIQLIARTSILLPPVYISDFKKKTSIFASSERLKRYRDNSIDKGNKNIQINKNIEGFEYKELIPDDNSYANSAIKKHILKNLGLPESLYTLFTNYMACHVWGLPNDPRYYDNLQNLALVPSFLGGLTDHNPEIQLILKYRVFSLYGFYRYNNVHSSLDFPSPNPLKDKLYNDFKRKKVNPLYQTLVWRKMEKFPYFPNDI